ncbi:hypothetical protein HK405_004822, partial [Cladochytrium tenue]
LSVGTDTPPLSPSSSDHAVEVDSPTNSLGQSMTSFSDDIVELDSSANSLHQPTSSDHTVDGDDPANSLGQSTTLNHNVEFDSSTITLNQSTTSFSDSTVDDDDPANSLSYSTTSDNMVEVDHPANSHRQSTASDHIVEDGNPVNSLGVSTTPFSDHTAEVDDPANSLGQSNSSGHTVKVEHRANLLGQSTTPDHMVKVDDSANSLGESTHVNEDQRQTESTPNCVPTIAIFVDHKTVQGESEETLVAHPDMSALITTDMQTKAILAVCKDPTTSAADRTMPDYLPEFEYTENGAVQAISSGSTIVSIAMAAWSRFEMPGAAGAIAFTLGVELFAPLSVVLFGPVSLGVATIGFGVSAVMAGMYIAKLAKLNGVPTINRYVVADFSTHKFAAAYITMSKWVDTLLVSLNVSAPGVLEGVIASGPIRGAGMTPIKIQDMGNLRRYDGAQATLHISGSPTRYLNDNTPVVVIFQGKIAGCGGTSGGQFIKIMTWSDVHVGDLTADIPLGWYDIIILPARPIRIKPGTIGNYDKIAQSDGLCLYCLNDGPKRAVTSEGFVIAYKYEGHNPEDEYTSEPAL